MRELSQFYTRFLQLCAPYTFLCLDYHDVLTYARHQVVCSTIFLEKNMTRLDPIFDLEIVWLHKCTCTRSNVTLKLAYSVCEFITLCKILSTIIDGWRNNVKIPAFIPESNYFHT